MKSNKSWLVVLVLLLVVTGLGAAAYVLLNGSDEGSNTNTTTSAQEGASTPAVDDTADQTEAADLPTIVFTDDGFSQKEYRVPEGTAVRVDNRSSMDLQFSSDDHPTHKNDPELNMALLGAGESGTFNPPGKGTYGFHDHINDQFEGTLIVE